MSRFSKFNARSDAFFFANWARTRAKGRSRFILSTGSQYAVFLAVMLAYTARTAQNVTPKIVFILTASAFVFSIVGGIVVATLVWFICEAGFRAYRRKQGKAESN